MTVKVEGRVLKAGGACIPLRASAPGASRQRAETIRAFILLLPGAVFRRGLSIVKVLAYATRFLSFTKNFSKSYPSHAKIISAGGGQAQLHQ